ncbi:alkaline phosphatase [Luteimonas viscosa]|uniref:Alkaline phosphatase n=1 Tax=Luteimonas viscosa TaxID=1132694 RepID=A0A5D4XRS8_9GAMM|nr:alkaline phosphatase [Luteimonas viscosa]TYT26774.1 alkaline phosphatase [Luteimonas viscosa]
MRPLPTALSTALAVALLAAPVLSADTVHPIRKGMKVDTPREETPQRWYNQGARTARDAGARATDRNKARNVILFVGDGMGVSTVSAARILEGQLDDRPGEENRLSFERMPYLALSKTYSVDGQTPDSAPTATAMVAGIKTNQGVIGVTQYARHNDCASSRGQEVASILGIAEALGLATGVVSTARITHATPAAAYAHTPNRDWESDAELTDEAKRNGCKDIARQLVEFPYGDGIDVVLGGGRSYFLPETVADPEDAGARGRRKDGRNLAQEFASRPGASYVWNRAQFNAIEPGATRKLLGLFERSHMEYEYDRPTDAGKEPVLAAMTRKAVEILQANAGDKGFFLMVEAGRIDHAHHAGNASRALSDTIALSDAVRVARALTSEEDTLIVVTADHSHAFTIAGYPDRGNDILGNVVSGGQLALAGDGKPYTTVGYANGPGYRGDGARPDLTTVDTTDPDFLQEATVPLGSETHSAEDVGIYASGPGAHAFAGVVEQNVIFHVMAQSQKNINDFLCALFGGCGTSGIGARAGGRKPIQPPLMAADLRAGMAQRKPLSTNR